MILRCSFPFDPGGNRIRTRCTIPGVSGSSCSTGADFGVFFGTVTVNEKNVIAHSSSIEGMIVHEIYRLAKDTRAYTAVFAGTGSCITVAFPLLCQKISASPSPSRRYSGIFHRPASIVDESVIKSVTSRGCLSSIFVHVVVIL